MESSPFSSLPPLSGAFLYTLHHASITYRPPVPPRLPASSLSVLAPRDLVLSPPGLLMNHTEQRNWHLHQKQPGTCSHSQFTPNPSPLPLAIPKPSTTPALQHSHSAAPRLSQPFVIRANQPISLVFNSTSHSPTPTTFLLPFLPPSQHTISPTTKKLHLIVLPTDH